MRWRRRSPLALCSAASRRSSMSAKPNVPCCCLSWRRRCATLAAAWRRAAVLGWGKACSAACKVVKAAKASCSAEVRCTGPAPSLRISAQVVWFKRVQPVASAGTTSASCPSAQCCSLSSQPLRFLSEKLRPSQPWSLGGSCDSTKPRITATRLRQNARSASSCWCCSCCACAKVWPKLLPAWASSGTLPSSACTSAKSASTLGHTCSTCARASAPRP